MMFIEISVVVTSQFILCRKPDLNSDSAKPDLGSVDVDRSSSPLGCKTYDGSRSIV